MTEEKRINIENTINILMQLDERSLLLIDSGAKMLMARQRLENKVTESKENKEIADLEREKEVV